MNDEVQTIRQRLQDLHEMHATGFVDDDQYAESLAVLERRLVDAVMRAEVAPLQAGTPAPPMLQASAPPLMPPAPRRWRLWAVALLLVPGAALGVWWWVLAQPGTAGASAASTSAVNTSAANTSAANTSVASVAPAAALPSSAATVAADPPPAAARLESPPAAGVAVPSGAPTAAAPTGTGISGLVLLSPALATRARPDDAVFVYARALDGPPMPLAVIRKQVRDLPLRFTLDDSMAMWPAAKVSAFPRVVVTARVSKSGEGVARPGDLEGISPPVAAGASGLQIEIAAVVP